MRRRHLTESDLDRLLSGLMEPDDAPPEYAAVTQLVLEAKAAARSPFRPASDAVPVRRLRPSGRKVASVAMAVAASTWALAGVGALPSAATDLTAYVARQIIEIGTDSGSNDHPEPPESPAMEPPAEQPQYATHVDETSTTRPTTTSLLPKAQGQPANPDPASSDSQSNESKGPGPKEPDTLDNSGGHANPHATPPDNSKAGFGGGPPTSVPADPPTRS